MESAVPFVRHHDDVCPVRCPCGHSTRLITRADGSAVGLHVTHFSDAELHRHARTTEIYYVLAGAGTVELGDERVAVRPGHAIYIPPGTPHRATGDLEVIVVTSPAFDPEDEQIIER